MATATQESKGKKGTKGGEKKDGERKPRGKKPQQGQLMETHIEGEETLIELFDKHEELASERGRLGKEMQEIDEAVLAEMKSKKIKAFRRNGRTMVVSESEKVKYSRDGESSEGGDGGADDPK